MGARLGAKNLDAVDFLERVAPAFPSGCDEEAIAAFREAIRIDPQNDWSHYFLAVMLENNGQLLDAADEILEASRLLPEKRTEAKQRLRRLLP